MPRARVKICGLRDKAGLRAAVDGGAAYVGFVFYPRSPRHVGTDLAAGLAGEVPAGLCKVALTVDASDDDLVAILDRVPIDMLQLHGRETPQRVAELRGRFGLPVMKAVGLRDAGDLDALGAYAGVADQLLVDARPPAGQALPGGNGVAFDWKLIAGRRWAVPWMLAGGLTPDNVAEAVRLTGARQVDVSSGVESAPGVKDPAAIARFLEAV